MLRMEHQNLQRGECSIIELKRIFLLSLFEWRTALSGLDIPSVLDFVDFCNFW